MVYLKTVICLFLSLCLTINPALAFGPKGHRTTAFIAEQFLTPTAADAIAELLDGQSLAYASTWADEMRSSRDNPEFWSSAYTGSWHYVNIPDGEHYGDSSPSDRGDAYVALQSFIAILKDEPVPSGHVREGLELYFGDLNAPENKQDVQTFALRFLIHIIGDLHQPLHVGLQEDLGGNQINVRWFGERYNLHQVWDTQLVEYQGLSYTELSDKLLEGMEDWSETRRNAVASTPSLQWLKEGLELRESAYDTRRFDNDFGYDYAFEFVPLIEEQMLKAGLRMAVQLNAIFDPAFGP